jgi:hypothetical protein
MQDDTFTALAGMRRDRLKRYHDLYWQEWNLWAKSGYRDLRAHDSAMLWRAHADKQRRLLLDMAGADHVLRRSLLSFDNDH